MASTFVDHPGAPLLAVTTVCDGSTTMVAVVQSRYLPDGSQAAQAGPWHVPACMRYQAGDAVQRKCGLITTERAEVSLDSVGCPSWIQPNAAAAGYYRWRLPEPQLLALVARRAQLNAPEQVALPGNLDALLVAAQLDGGTYLDALGYLVQGDQRQVVDASVGGWHRLYHATVDYEGGAPADDFAAYVRRSLGARAHRLGMLPRAGEDPQTELLRTTVIPAVADIGRDRALRTQASDLARRFLRNTPSVPAAAARIAIPIAAHEGDARLHAALVNALAHAQTPHERSIVLSGLGSFRDPTLFEHSLQLYLTDTLRVGDFWAVAGHMGDTPALQSVGFAWMTEHFDSLAAKLGDDSVSSLPALGTGFCDAAGRERVAQFFSAPAHQRPGSARTLAQSLEAIDQCIQLRGQATKSVATFLHASQQARH